MLKKYPLQLDCMFRWHVMIENSRPFEASGLISVTLACLQPHRLDALVRLRRVRVACTRAARPSRGSGSTRRRRRRRRRETQHPSTCRANRSHHHRTAEVENDPLVPLFAVLACQGTAEVPGSLFAIRAHFKPVCDKWPIIFGQVVRKRYLYPQKRPGTYGTARH